MGEEFNNWLKQFLHTQVFVNLNIPDKSTANYYELLKFLEEGQIRINNIRKELLYVTRVFMGIICNYFIKSMLKNILS